MNIDKHWSKPIGDFFVAFCGIELYVIKWILASAKDPIRNHIAGLNLSKRISLLTDLLIPHNSLNHAAADVSGVLPEIKFLSEKRNTIAHNPLVFHIPKYGDSDTVMRECILNILNEAKKIEFEELLELVSRAERAEAVLSKNLYSTDWVKYSDHIKSGTV